MGDKTLLLVTLVTLENKLSIFPIHAVYTFSVDQWEMNNNVKNQLLIWQISRIWKLTFIHFLLL